MRPTLAALCLLLFAASHALEARLFNSKKEEKYFFREQAKLRARAGTEKQQEHYNTKSLGSTVATQFSHADRLNDNIIFLTALFRGQLHHQKFGNLKDRFVKPLFLDLGSSLVYKQGALTVRKIYSNKFVYNNLGRLVASDINDYRYNKTQFYSIYRQQKKKLPFRAIEIDTSITRPYQVTKMLADSNAPATWPVIFRAVNTGIDYYYETDRLKAHLRAVVRTLSKTDFMYILNRFVLFKAKESKHLHIIGEFDETAFATEFGQRWKKINWKKRKLKDGFKENSKYMRVIPLKHLKGLQN